MTRLQLVTIQFGWLCRLLIGYNLKQRMKRHYRDLWINEGEFVIIPHGVEHLPVAEEEVQVVLLEPKLTLNTGNVQNERTVSELQHL
jgi:hypothetical protein